MNMQYEIRFYIKTPYSKTVSIFVDEQPLHKQNGKYIWSCDGANHKLRIEQDRIFKSKWYWVSAPLIFLMGIISYDAQTDGKTPFYAVYEANIFIDKNMEGNITLFDIYRYTDVSKQDWEYKIKVEFSKEVNLIVVKDEFLATKKQRVSWFVMNAVLHSLLIGFVVFICISLGIKSLSAGGSIGDNIFLWLISAILILLWIFITYKIYRHSKGEYKR